MRAFHFRPPHGEIFSGGPPVSIPVVDQIMISPDPIPLSQRFGSWLRGGVWLLCGWTLALSAGFGAGADFMTVRPAREGTNLSFGFDLTRDTGSYFILQDSTNLPLFAPLAVNLFGGSNAWSLTVAAAPGTSRFWRGQRVPTFNPYDLDGDGIDDFYELTHGLNALDPGDASLLSGFADFDGNPLTWLDQYRYHFQHQYNLYDTVGRELSVFNFGQPTAGFEGISREISLFNTPQPDADRDGIDDLYERLHGLNPDDPFDAGTFSGFTDDFPNNAGHALIWRELYRFHFARNTVLYDTVSRESSVFNFGQPTANYEAISREVSLFNVPTRDSDGDGLDDTYEISHGLNPLNPADAGHLSGFTLDFPSNAGRLLTWLETYRYHFGKNTVLYEVVSREVSVFNFGQPAANYEAVSREVSVFNFGQAAANYEAVSREVSLFNQP